MTETDPIPTRVAAIDFGKKRIGVAVCDELMQLAHPRPTLDGSSSKQAIQLLATLAKEESIQLFLVGLPLHADGSMSTMAQEAMTFAQQLADATGIQVELMDERFTSAQAHVFLNEANVRGSKRKGKVDAVAATVILQSWLDAKRNDHD